MKAYKLLIVLSVLVLAFSLGACKKDKEKPTYSVTFNTTGGSTIENQTVKEGDLAKMPVQPVKTGYIFAGWDWKFNTPVVENIVITASWQAVTYQINYHANDGSLDKLIQDAVYDTAVDIFGNDVFTKNAYELIGWNTDAEGEGDFYPCNHSFTKFTIPRDLDFYAVWKATEYTITYNLFDGINGDNNPVYYTVEDENIILGNAEKVGYDFGGWYKDSSFENKVEQIDTSKKERIELFALFVPTVYNITYHLFDGTNGENNPETYTIETETITLEIPVKTGNTFGGWYTDSEFTDKIEQITLGSHGNLNLYADWQLWGGGEGTEESPYIISNADLLKTLAIIVNAGNPYNGVYFVLSDNISLGNLEWTPIGINEANYFGGNFDGENHTITNFKITAPRAYAGLFGYNKGLLEHLVTEGVAINLSFAESSVYGGGLVGYSEGRIVNCAAAGTITLTSTTSFVYAGGLAGYITGELSDSFAFVSISANASNATAYAGGLAGFNLRGTIDSCYASGNVIAAGLITCAGGLAGENSYGTVISSKSSGNVNSEFATASTISVGGLIGKNNRGKIERSYGSGESVRATTSYSYSIVRAGGLVGFDDRGEIKNCFSTSKIISAAYHAYAGGLVGDSNAGTISFCYAAGDVSATASSISSEASAIAGGLIGVKTGTATGSYASGNVSATTNSPAPEAIAYAGGLVGENFGTATSCYRYIGQTITITKNYVPKYLPSNDVGANCNADNLSTESFFIETLTWDNTVWLFEGIDFVNGIYPIIKNV